MCRFLSEMAQFENRYILADDLNIVLNYKFSNRIRVFAYNNSEKFSER